MIHIPLRVYARMDLGKQTVQVFFLPLPFHQRVKSIVRPQDAAVLQRNGIGHRQLLQERILDPLILGRKLDQIRQNQRPVVKIQSARNPEIDQDKNGHNKSGLLIDHKDPDIHRRKQDRHNQRPAHIHPELSFQTHFIFLLHIKSPHPHPEPDAHNVISFILTTYYTISSGILPLLN